MKGSAKRHPALRAWPVDPRDALPMALWSSREVEQATGGSASHAFQAAGVEMDSRDVRPGDLFVALKGEAMDGHRFIPQAFAAGAVAAITDRPVEFPHVQVSDTTAALHALAHRARDRAGRVGRGAGVPARQVRVLKRPPCSFWCVPARWGPADI